MTGPQANPFVAPRSTAEPDPPRRHSAELRPGAAIGAFIPICFAVSVFQAMTLDPYLHSPLVGVAVLAANLLISATIATVITARQHRDLG